MKTPIQELMDSVGYMSQGLDADELYDYFMEKAKQMLEKEKEYFMAYGFSCCLMTKQKNSWSLEDLFNEHFNTQENPQDSTNGYTYYPQENKTVFNTKEK